MHVPLPPLRLGEPRRAGRLTVFPLLDPTAGDPRYLSFADVVRTGAMHIDEVNESGHVPELVSDNAGPVPVFLLDGEELRGARQNRIINLSILVPAHTRLKIPVSCVERGRWAWRSRGFAPSDAALHARAP